MTNTLKSKIVRYKVKLIFSSIEVSEECDPSYLKYFQNVHLIVITWLKNTSILRRLLVCVSGPRYNEEQSICSEENTGQLSGGSRELQTRNSHNGPYLLSSSSLLHCNIPFVRPAFRAKALCVSYCKLIYCNLVGTEFLCIKVC